jgi:ribosome-associated toxin RatA of RatAB toxin-antitoxin module
MLSALVPAHAVSDPAPAPEVRVSDRAGTAVASGSIFVRAPPERVWRVMLDCDRAPTFVPRLERCRVLDADPDGGGDVREHVVRFAVIGRVRHVFRSSYRPYREIRTERVGGDLKAADGTWTLEPAPGGTRVSFRVALAVNAPVPGPLVRGALRRDTEAMLRALAREAAGSRP